MATVSSLMDYAQKETAHIVSEEKFLVKDLFKGYEWNRIPIAERLRLGAMFFEYAKTTLDIIPISKSSSKQQIYEKK